jgi:hypothetical protein
MLSTNSMAHPNARTAGRRRRLILRPLGQLARVIIGVALLIAAATGAFLFVNGAGTGSNMPPDIEGTWELSNLGGAAPGDGHLCGVLWQRVAFRAGKLRGETMVLTDSTTAGQKLPFPDESVDKVVPNSDGGGVRVIWSGSYEFDKDQVTLHVGKAIYFVRVKWQAGGEALELNQDVILICAGAAAYGRANSVHQSRFAGTVPLSSPAPPGPAPWTDGHVNNRY